MSAPEAGRGAAVYLIRHGETEFNAAGRYQGQADSPLTARGRMQAAAVGALLRDHLKASGRVRLITSPLQRAVSTAGIVAGELGLTARPEVDRRLTEVGMGAWEGLTRAEIAAGWPRARRGRSQREWIFHAPGGERLHEVRHRVGAVLRDYLSDPAGQGGHPEAIVLISHAMAGRVMRGVHGRMPLLEALRLDAWQSSAYALIPGGEIREYSAH